MRVPVCTWSINKQFSESLQWEYKFISKDLLKFFQVCFVICSRVRTPFLWICIYQNACLPIKFQTANKMIFFFFFDVFAQKPHWDVLIGFHTLGILLRYQICRVRSLFMDRFLQHLLQQNKISLSGEFYFMGIRGYLAPYFMEISKQWVTKLITRELRARFWRQGSRGDFLRRRRCED